MDDLFRRKCPICDGSGEAIMRSWDMGATAILHYKEHRISAYLRSNYILSVGRSIGSEGYELERPGYMGHELFGDDKFTIEKTVWDAIDQSKTNGESGISVHLGNY